MASVTVDRVPEMVVSLVTYEVKVMWTWLVEPDIEAVAGEATEDPGAPVDMMDAVLGPVGLAPAPVLLAVAGAEPVAAPVVDPELADGEI